MASFSSQLKGTQRLRRWFALPHREQAMLLEAGFCLALARLALWLPFRWLKPLTGRAESGADQDGAALGAEDKAEAVEVGGVVSRVANRLPWQSSCLVRAIAGRMLLRRRGLPAVLELGVRTGGPSDLMAHAWLRCGDTDVIGVDNAAEYTPIAAFKP